VTKPVYALRPFLMADTMELRELFAQSIEELTQEDYDEDQRVAWASAAADAEAFGTRLAEMVTLVAHLNGETAGFASLKDNKTLEMLYVHPYHAGQGAGTLLATAIEKLAAARGCETLTVTASETAVVFFEGRGYRQLQRNSVPVEDLWLTNTTMTKTFNAPPAPAGK
jgi:putative acetyltransferase